MDIPNYRRNFLLGGSYFFTVSLADRRLALLTENISLLRAAFRSVRARHPFTIDAAVVLPDHLHVIWTLPEDDADFAAPWRLIKSAFSYGLPCREAISVSRSAKGERGIWQRRYWEHTLRDQDEGFRGKVMGFAPLNPSYELFEAKSLSPKASIILMYGDTTLPCARGWEVEQRSDR